MEQRQVLRAAGDDAGRRAPAEAWRRDGSAPDAPGAALVGLLAWTRGEIAEARRHWRAGLLGVSDPPPLERLHMLRLPPDEGLRCLLQGAGWLRELSADQDLAPPALDFPLPMLADPETPLTGVWEAMRCLGAARGTDAEAGRRAVHTLARLPEGKLLLAAAAGSRGHAAAGADLDRQSTRGRVGLKVTHPAPASRSRSRRAGVARARTGTCRTAGWPQTPHPALGSHRVETEPSEVLVLPRRSTGIVRRLDRLGRIVIPKEVRDAFRIGRDAQLAFAVDGDAMALQRPEVACVFCDTTEHVIPHRGKGICVDCVREVRGLVSGSVSE